VTDESERALEQWNRAAGAYSMSRGHGALSLSAIYEPAIEQLLGDVFGKRVLEAGCGDGSYACKLATRGASATAVDGSPEMISIAVRGTERGDIDYRVADLTKPLELPEQQFDVVLANMVLMDIPRIDVAIAEFARVLRRGGIFVFSLTHPCFFCSDWIYDERGTKLHKAVADYLSTKVEAPDFWGTTLHFHRPLSQYFGDVTRHGFVIDALMEPMPSEEAVAQHPDWQHHRRIPSFIVIRVVRS
jgi:SAM-dependent methyltransferase